MLQLYSSHFLVLYWKFSHVINVIYFKQHQLVMMKFSLKYITMIVHIYIYIYISEVGCTSQQRKSALTDTVTSMDVLELSHTGKQAMNWAAACTLVLPFFMHSLATSGWVSPLVCVAVISSTMETPEIYRRYQLSLQSFRKEMGKALETGRATLCPSWGVAVLVQALLCAPLWQTEGLGWGEIDGKLKRRLSLSEII